MVALWPGFGLASTHLAKQSRNDSESKKGRRTEWCIGGFMAAAERSGPWAAIASWSPGHDLSINGQLQCYYSIVPALIRLTKLELGRGRQAE